MTIIITGGAGFIGSHVVRRFVTKYPGYRIINLDALTYAGNLENLRDIENSPNYSFEKADILDADQLERIFSQYKPDGIIHLAAESHVDRSILSPLDFVYTAKALYAVYDLIAKQYFSHASKILFIHSGGLQGNRSLQQQHLLFFGN